MDTHAHKAKAEANTAEWIFYFFVAITGSACVLYLPILLIANNVPAVRDLLLTPVVFMWCFTSALLIIGCSSLAKLWQLRKGGGKLVAVACGASPLTCPMSPQEQMFSEIVEELSRASNIKQPSIYVIRHERGINAFVAGSGKHDETVIAVTQGALNNLTYDELKGIAGHELSHMINCDVPLSTQLSAIVCGVSALSMLGHYCAMFGGAGQLFAAILVYGGSFGRLCAHAMQASISRQRELLADVSSAQLIGSPLGLAGALKKIAALKEGSSLTTETAAYFNHLMLSDCRNCDKRSWWLTTAIRKSMFKMLASHPPIEERIRLLDPTFDGDLSEIRRAMQISENLK